MGAILARRFFGSALTLTAILALATAVALAACSADDVGPKSRMVGGRCTSDGDCVQRCLTDGTAFPGGYCTVPCTSSDDCPGGATCAAMQGGVCLATCRDSEVCADYGPDYQCTAVTGQSVATTARACIGG